MNKQHGKQVAIAQVKPSKGCECNYRDNYYGDQACKSIKKQ